MHRTKSHLIKQMVCMLMLAAALSLASSAFAEDAKEPVPSFMHLPVVEEDADTSSGLKTTWSCVSFGKYPSAEVVTSEWDAVDSYALREGDVIRDDTLYADLAQADWKNNMTLIDGQTYLREKADIPTTGEVEIREQHYRFTDPDEWHYFVISPIRWRVLDIQGDKVLLLADRMPDSMPFHDVDEDVTWGESTLRSWLNGYGASENLQKVSYEGDGFLDLAFTADEKAAILPVKCENKVNFDYGTGSGPDTEDSIFILSNADVFEGEQAGRYGFEPSRNYDDPAKRFTSTLYAKFRGAWWSPVPAYAGNSFWFMRTSGYTSRSVTYICDFGFVYSKGTLVACSDAGIIPAMWVDLGKALEAGLGEAGETLSTDIIKDSSKDVEAAALQIADPVVTEDSDMPGGKYTVWDAVAFGHYPQTEILEKSPDENGVEEQGSVKGQISVEDQGSDKGKTRVEGQGRETEQNKNKEQEVDPELFQALEQSAGSGDDDDDEIAQDHASPALDEVTLDNTTYVKEGGRWFRCDPIIWRVLDVSDGFALLASDRILDSVPYDSEYKDVCWEESDLRQWLNGRWTEEMTDEELACYGSESFMDCAFTEEEQKAVIVSSVSNDNNYYFKTVCGSGTHDRVFIPSEEEVFCSEKAVEYGFRPDDAVADPGRRLLPTAFAVCRGAWQSEKEETSGNGFWLLRTNGYTQDNVVYVGEKGYLYNRGIPVTCRDAGIVPVIRVDLNEAKLVQVDDITSRLVDSSTSS